MLADSTSGKPFILAINGSPNPDGTVSNLLREAVSVAELAGATVQYEHLLPELPRCDGRRLERIHPRASERIALLPERGDLRRITESAMRAHGILFGTSVFSFGIPSALKDLIDWWFVTLERPDFKLRGKIVGGIAVCEEDGSQMALNSFLIPLLHMQCKLPYYANCIYNKHAAHRSEDGCQLNEHKLLGRSMVDEIRWNWDRATPELPDLLVA